MSAGNDGFFSPANQNDQGVLGQHQIFNGFSAPVMELIDGDFPQMDVIFSCVSGCAEYECISFFNDGISLGNEIFAAAAKENQQASRRKVKLSDGFSCPGMISCYGDADKLHVNFIGIVIEGSQYISAFIDHFGFSGTPGKKSSLNGDGEQNDAEHNME